MAENDGDLDLCFSDIAELPKGLKVAGDLWLQHTEIQELPEDLVVMGSLDLHNTLINKLPDNLCIGGDLGLRNTAITELPPGLTVGGDLDLQGAKITELPAGLSVGWGLFLMDTPITELPDNLCIGGDLGLRNTAITELPPGLTVGGDLDLQGAKITKLPLGLTVGAYLNLKGTQITELPDDLAVGGTIFSDSDFPQEQMSKVHRLKNGDCGDGSYIYADRILTPVKEVRRINGYTLYVGKIPRDNVVSDGEFYAHCENFREGIADIAFKRAKNRGADQYRSIDRSAPIPLEEAKTMYRVVTDACRQGTENFVQRLKTTGKLKDAYTVNEMLEVTKGQYGAKTFAKFFA